ncbi:MAG: glycosyltransferase [Crocinitomicaceae bacterium]
MTQLTPIAIFAYNRPAHLAETIEQLLSCDMASESTVYIFSDGPKNTTDETKVQQVRDYVKKVTGFKFVNLIERHVNLGLAKSIVSGVNTVFKEHSRIIVLEDDMLVGKHFLIYANTALELFENDSDVWVISGYAYNLPIKRKQAYFLPTSSNQAWASWKDRWEKIDFQNPDLSGIEKKISRWKFNELGAIDYSDRLTDTVQSKKSNSWAIILKWYLFKNRGLTLFPSKNLVRNIGWDGSGTNCKTENPYEEYTSEINYHECNYPKRIRYRRIDYLSLILFHYIQRIKSAYRNRFKSDRRS